VLKLGMDVVKLGMNEVKLLDCDKDEDKLCLVVDGWCSVGDK
jgi:hypothetical protein